MEFAGLTPHIMENIHKSSVSEFVKPAFIINALALITTLFFGYKFYFDNDGKGIDALLFALAIYSLNSFFAAMAALNYFKNKSKAKREIISGLIFTLLCSAYIYFEIFNNVLLIGVITVTMFPIVFF